MGKNWGGRRREDNEVKENEEGKREFNIWKLKKKEWGIGLKAREIEPPRWMPCEAEKKNMKEEGGRKEQKMRREGQQRKVMDGRWGGWRRREEKRQRNKCCPPENWHAEGQHLLRIMGPALVQHVRTHTLPDACSYSSRLNETKHLSGAPICLCQ